MERDMHLLLVGMNHRTAGLDQREALACTDRQLRIQSHAGRMTIAHAASGASSTTSPV